MKHSLRRDVSHARASGRGAIRAAAAPAVQSRHDSSANVVEPPSADAFSPDITFVERQEGITDGTHRQSSI